MFLALLLAAAPTWSEYEVVGFSPDGAVAALIVSSQDAEEGMVRTEAWLFDTGAGPGEARLETIHDEIKVTVPALRSAWTEKDPYGAATSKLLERVHARLDARGNAKLEDGQDAGRIHLATRAKAQTADEKELAVFPPPAWLNLSWVPPGGGPAVRLHDDGDWKHVDHAWAYKIVEARISGDSLLVVLRDDSPGYEMTYHVVHAYAARLPKKF